MRAAEHLLSWGGMPALLHLDEGDRRDWLRSYIDTYLQRDLGDLARVRDLGPFARLQRLTALRTAGVLSYAELARDAGTSPSTARNYLEYLRLSYQAFLLPPYATNKTTGTIKAPKVYWGDLGLARQLAGAWGPVTGELFETAVVNEAVKTVKTAGLEAELSFYRTRGGGEVDLIAETPRGVVAVEAKARPTWSRVDLRGLRGLSARLGDALVAGVLVTLAGPTGGEIERADEEGRLWVVPFHRLFT